MSRKGILFCINNKIDNKVNTSRLLLKLTGKHKKNTMIRSVYVGKKLTTR